jgi:hypothetical protein
MSNDTVTLISRDGKDKIVCFKYMEECFQKEGYISSKRVYIRLLYLLYKLFDFTIFRKIKVFFILCIRCKFFFKNPKCNEFVIFDTENTITVKKILPNKNYTPISTRIDQINEIYVSKRIIFYVMKNFFKHSLKQNYLTALIKVIAPKIVITQIFDSKDFHVVSKILHNEIEFIAIQNYAPSRFDTMFSEEDKKIYFIPKLFCFGEFDELFYKKRKVNIGTFEAVGSIKSSLSYEYVKSEKLKINPNKYDICLISEPNDQGVFNGSGWGHVKNLLDSTGLVAEFTHRLCKKHNLNMIFSGKGYNDGKVSDDRQTYFYKHYLKNYDFKISRISPYKKEETDFNYAGYINIMQSKLVIAIFSTMLREAISFQKKILFFNTTGHPDIEFPGSGIKFPQDSICILNEPSYELFEERVLRILSITNEEYFSQLGKEKSFIMIPTVETANVIRKRVKEIAEQNPNKDIK